MAILGQYKKVIVSYSGGVDSTLVAFYAQQKLANNALIVIGDSPSLARDELKLAKKLAKTYSFHLKIIYPQEFNNPHYLKNNPNRCFYCKQNLFQELNQLKEQEKAEVIIDGTNYDDLQDIRPGLKAARQKKVLHPLVQAQLTKKEIRQLARKNGLPNHDKPAAPCLASRIPHSIKITWERIKKVEKAEKFLRDVFRVSPLRVRYQDDLAKIECSPRDIALLKKEKQKVLDFFKSLGFFDFQTSIKK